MLQSLFDMSREDYIKVLRYVTGITALGLWATSIKFSIDGFGIDGMNWVALFLGLAVTVIQLVWNHIGNNGNYTIVFGGILAYAYGIYTNVSGIYLAQGGIQILFSTDIIFPLILGLFLEVMPEPLLIWALTGLTDLGDFIGNVGNTVIGESKRKPKPKTSSQPNKPRQQPKQQPKQQPRRQHNGQNKMPSSQPDFDF